jgi:beta-galactosidase
MFKNIFIPATTICFFIIASFTANAQHKSFEIKNGQFLYNGRPLQVHSGEMHYARVPKAYWRHRLQMLKAMGLNTVATYVFWNYHNTAPGVWDFESGNRDIKTFIRTAQEEGLLVILRPGPYACAEWEFGGYPWWLLKDSNIVVRTYNQPFLDSCKNYLHQLLAQVKPFFIKNGGPVILVQAENEFGSYAAQQTGIPKEQHKEYNTAILNLLKETGFDVNFFTSDGTWLFDDGHLPGILPTANGEGNVQNLKEAVNKYHNNEGPYMVAEYYPGWLHHWGEPFPDIPAEEVVKQLEIYLKDNISFNIYMAHGGTNFGFTAGANYDKEHDIQPDLTTYDYDAPISEAGWATPKFMAIRQLMQRYTNKPLPAIPPPPPVITLPVIKLTKAASLFELKDKMKPVYADDVLSFEDLNQPYGYVLYSRKFTQPIKGQLTINGLRDFATVYINKKKAGVLNRMNNIYTLPVDIPFNATLDILVENMGRINYGAAITHNKKGIISPVQIDDKIITGGWRMYGFPFDTMPAATPVTLQATGGPKIYTATFTIQTPGDIFLNMQKWGKGIVFVNGHNLCRYWHVGPQQTLYLPGAFLKKGKNTITVFEQQNEISSPEIETVKQPILKVLNTPSL